MFLRLAEAHTSLPTPLTDIHEHKASLRYRFNRSGDVGHPVLDNAPVVRAQHQDSDSSGGEVLLVGQFLIRCDEKLKSILLGRRQERAVVQARPTAERRRHHRVPRIDQQAATSVARSRPGEFSCRARCFGALRREIEHGQDLFAAHWEILKYLVERGALPILENGSYWNTRSAKQPSAADLARNALDCPALRPIDGSHREPFPIAGHSTRRRQSGAMPQVTRNSSFDIH
jgi:hypothetical protein